jgi:hypothetical protein
MARMDEAQEEEEHLGPYGDLMRMVAMTAFQRAADLIVLNNRAIERQLAAAGIAIDSPTGHQEEPDSTGDEGS